MVNFWPIIGGGLDTSVKLQIGLRIESICMIEKVLSSFVFILGRVEEEHHECVESLS